MMFSLSTVVINDNWKISQNVSVYIYVYIYNYIDTVCVCTYMHI